MPTEKFGYKASPMPYIGAGEYFEAASNYSPNDDWAPPKDIIRTVEGLINEAIELSYSLDMDTPTIWFSDKDITGGQESSCAVYLSGSASLPAMVIFTDAFEHIPERSLPRALATTIWHELAHALLETKGVENLGKEVEEICEGFAACVEDEGKKKALEYINKKIEQIT